jgi:predicted nucleotidyltransferase
MSDLAEIDTATQNVTHTSMDAVASRYDITGAILFGGRVRKSHRPDSYVDVAVRLHGRPGQFVATTLAMAELAYEVLLDTGIRIQPLPIWEDEWKQPEAHSTPRLLHNIDRDGVRL